jgi:hypothetical protein
MPIYYLHKYDSYDPEWDRPYQLYDPLLCALQMKQYDELEIMMKSHSDVNKKYPGGTLLHIHLKNCHRDYNPYHPLSLLNLRLLLLLLRFGVNPDLLDSNDQSGHALVQKFGYNIVGKHLLFKRPKEIHSYNSSRDEIYN